MKPRGMSPIAADAHSHRHTQMFTVELFIIAKDRGADSISFNQGLIE